MSKWIEKSTKEGINCKSKEISERRFDEYDDKYEMRNEKRLKKSVPGKTFFGGEFNKILEIVAEAVVQMKYMYLTHVAKCGKGVAW